MTSNWTDSIDDYRGKVHFAVITVKSEEEDSVLKRFPRQHIVQGKRNYGLCRVENVNKVSTLVATIRQPKQGNIHASQITNDVIADLDPTWILLVGIAGATPFGDAVLGDVVLGTHIHDLTVHARNANGGTSFSASGGSVSVDVEATAIHLRSTLQNIVCFPRPGQLPDLTRIEFTTKNKEVNQNINKALKARFELGYAPKVLDGQVISTDALVKDVRLVRIWRSTMRSALAIEMESAGSYNASRTRSKTYAMLPIRGISDIVGLQKQEGWVLHACEVAAECAFEFVRNWSKPDAQSPSPVDMGERQTRATSLSPTTRVGTVVGEPTESRIFGGPSEALLPPEWWEARMNEALNAARPRYVPELRVDVPVVEGFDALTTSNSWSVRVARAIQELEERCESVDRCLSDAPDAAPPQELGGVKESVRSALAVLRGWSAGPSEHSRRESISALDRGLICLQAAERQALENLDKKYGPGKADSASWRQFMTEYQVSFPYETLDRVRELRDEALSVRALIFGPSGAIAGSSAALLFGAAGVGKTYAVCDIAAQRLARDELTLVFHGRWFSGCTDVLTQLRDLMQLPASITPGDAMALLDRAGASSGGNVLLVIDALNETVPRSIWRNHLERLLALAKQHTNVRLLLTVRTHYLTEVVPTGVEIPSWEHRGFERVEFEALFEYARHYKLEPPAVPPVRREFTNPLFLRLLCEAMKDSGRAQVDAEIGLDELVTMFVQTKDRIICERLEAPLRDHVAESAVTLMAQEMGATGQPWLARRDAQRITRAQWPGVRRDDSLLEALIAEGLVAEDRIPSPSSSGQFLDVVAFAFERLAQHLIIGSLLRSIPDVEAVRRALESGSLKALAFPNGNVDRGILEAMAIEIPQRFGVEVDGLMQSNRDQAISASIVGLPWRSAASVGVESILRIKEAISSGGENRLQALDALFSLATRDRHPINGDWLHALLSQSRMPERDSILLPWLFDASGSRGPVNAMIGWARRMPLGELRDSTAALWLTALLWCTGSNDRKVRDGATRGAVRIAVHSPSSIPVLLRRFLPVDDEWIVERALLTSYGALLCTHQNKQWHEPASILWQYFIVGERLPQNAIIRDLVRCIVEESVARSCPPSGLELNRIRPSYGSPFPTTWPTKNATLKYSDEQKYPKLVLSCTEDDFARYQVQLLLEDRLGAGTEGAKRWLVHEVVRLGYAPELFASFDRNIITRYGFGRGKPSEFERVGKKYQWVALARLAGIVADNKQPKLDRWDPPPLEEPTLQARRLRDLDPTLLAHFQVKQDQEQRFPWQPQYHWASVETSTNLDWLNCNDLPEPSLLFGHSDRTRIILTAGYRWRSEPPNSRKYPYRSMWMHIHGVLVKKHESQRLIAHFVNKDIVELGEPWGHSVGDGAFAGEYPFGVPLRETFNRIKHEGSEIRGVPVSAWPATNRLEGEFGYDGTDWTRVAFLLPHERFFGPGGRDLQWDGMGGWHGNSILVAKNSPSHIAEHELTMDGQWLNAWLTNAGLELIWLEVIGKDVIDGTFGKDRLPRVICSRVSWRDGETICHSPRYAE